MNEHEINTEGQSYTSRVRNMHTPTSITNSVVIKVQIKVSFNLPRSINLLFLTYWLVASLFTI